MCPVKRSNWNVSGKKVASYADYSVFAKGKLKRQQLPTAMESSKNSNWNVSDKKGKLKWLRQKGQTEMWQLKRIIYKNEETCIWKKWNAKVTSMYGNQ